MDIRFPDFRLFVILLGLFFKDAFCQVYSWSVSVPLNISVCSNSLSNPLTLDWTYTPDTLDPPFIEWSKQGTGGTFNNIATYAASTFTPSAAYTGRVNRTGKTAEIAIQGPLTAADGGVYQVTVSDSGGTNLLGFANLIFPVMNEPVNASCVETAANVYNVTCSVDVSPPVTLQLKQDSGFIDSASSASGLSKTLSDAHNKNFQCSVTGQGSECVTPNSAEVTCIGAAPVPVPEACGFALIAVIILVVLLVMKIATDVIFVGYRWGDRFGVKYKQICKQIIDTDKRKYILYWICFVQGIINSICGVTFFIVIFATCSESLGEGLPIAVIVIGIIVGSIGVINIVMCLCCCCCPKSSDPGKSDDPSPWLCCCCLGTIHPENKSSPDHPPPSSLPPIPPSMASPRKPPVPPSSTTPRTLPSPTSDPASDSAVNPSVHLEPLSVEAPKKKKKKRKKRKTRTTTEAGEESSDQPMNPTGDSDE